MSLSSISHSCRKYRHDYPGWVQGQLNQHMKVPANSEFRMWGSRQNGIVRVRKEMSTKFVRRTERLRGPRHAVIVGSGHPGEYGTDAGHEIIGLHRTSAAASNEAQYLLASRPGVPARRLVASKYPLSAVTARTLAGVGAERCAAPLRRVEWSRRLALIGPPCPERGH